MSVKGATQMFDITKKLSRAERVVYPLLYRAWTLWHCRLPHVRPFMGLEPGELLLSGARGKPKRRYWSGLKNRPWWHMCCNGDSGGWRTRFCSAMEWRWRAIERKMDHEAGAIL